MGAVTQILDQLRAGDSSAEERLFPLVYAELRSLADSYFRKIPPGHTLQPTILVHEVFLRLVSTDKAEWKGREHFLAVAAKAMRRLLINHARDRRTQKRGGGWERITLDEALADVETKTIDVLELDETMNRLAALSPRQAQIVELRVFGGMTIEEITQVLGLGATTVKSDWTIARAWLRRELIAAAPHDT